MKFVDFVPSMNQVFPTKHPLNERRLAISVIGPTDYFLQEASVFEVPATFDQVVYNEDITKECTCRTHHASRLDILTQGTGTACFVLTETSASTRSETETETDSVSCTETNTSCQTCSGTGFYLQDSRVSTLKAGHRAKDVVGRGQFAFDRGMSVMWYRLHLYFPKRANPRLYKATLYCGEPGSVGERVAVLARSSKPDRSPRTVSRQTFSENIVTNETLMKSGGKIVNIAQLFDMACRGKLYWDISGTVDIGKDRVPFFSKSDSGIAFVRGQFFDYTRQKPCVRIGSCDSPCAGSTESTSGKSTASTSGGKCSDTSSLGAATSQSQIAEGSVDGSEASLRRSELLSTEDGHAIELPFSIPPGVVPITYAVPVYGTPSHSCASSTE